MVNIGNLNTTITADASGFETNFKRADRAVDVTTKNIGRADVALTKLSRTSVRTGTQVARSSKRGQRAVLELSRGVEDAAVSFGTGGFAGAIRGAGNNISQMLAIMSPAAGIVGGFAVAIGSVLVGSLERGKKKVNELKKSIADLDALNKRISRGGRDTDFAERRGDLNKGPDLKGIQEELKSERKKITKERNIQVEAEAERQRKARETANRFTQDEINRVRRRTVTGKFATGVRQGQKFSRLETNAEVRARIRRGDISVTDVGNALRGDKQAGFAEAQTGIDKKINDSISREREARGRVAELSQDESKAKDTILKRSQADANKRLNKTIQDYRGRALRAGYRGATAVRDFDYAGYLGFGEQKKQKPLTKEQLLQKRLRVLNLRNSIQGGGGRASVEQFSPNSAATGQRGAFSAIGTAVRELAKASASSKDDKRDALQEEIKRIQQKQLDVLEAELKGIGVAELN